MADLVSDAIESFRENLEALREQRRQIAEDLEFSDPSNPRQWDPIEERQRLGDPGGARPCLVMDQIGQYVSNVVGQVEKSPPALHSMPVDSGADKKVSEYLDGFFRHIEHSSRAQQHYARASMAAARTGVGYLILRPEVIDKALNYQEPRISSEADPLRVVLDAFSTELDGSDADCGWLLTPMSHKAFERRFGKKAEKVSFGEEAGEMRRATEREEIVVAEQWRVMNDTRTMVVFVDPAGGEASLPEDEFKEAFARGDPMQYVREYKDKYRCVKWAQMSGAEVLTEETIYPASGIGIVPVYGYIGWANGRMTYCGMPRKARNPQRAYNYHVSEIRAYMNLAPKTPWIAPKRAVAGLEPLWDRASAEQRAWLPYNDIDEMGVIAPPQRPQVSTNLQNHVQGADQALRDIQAALGMYQANLGAPSNETSGIAIESRKQQGEASTANFPANLAASITQIGRLTMEMIPRLIDTRRQMRILGHDMAPSRVQVDPEQAQAVQELPQGGGISINPNVGHYDVRVVVGASFATQRSQTNTALNEVMARNPALTPAIAPLWAKSLDFAEAEKLSQVLTAMAPESVQAILKPEGEQESVPALKAQMQQMAQRIQEAAAIAQEAQQEADEAQAQLAEKSAAADAKEDEVAIKAYEAVTRRVQLVLPSLPPEAAAAVSAALIPDQGARVLAAQTMQAAMMQPNPMEAPGEPQTGESPMDEPQGPSPEMAQIMEGQQQLAQGLGQMGESLGQLGAAMGQLIRLVQAKRVRTPERGPDGSITRVVDSIDLNEMQAEGPMQ